jgi:hypothetical protein
MPLSPNAEFGKVKRPPPPGLGLPETGGGLGILNK